MSATSRRRFLGYSAGLAVALVLLLCAAMTPEAPENAPAAQRYGTAVLVPLLLLTVGLLTTRAVQARYEEQDRIQSARLGCPLDE